MPNDTTTTTAEYLRDIQKKAYKAGYTIGQADDEAAWIDRLTGEARSVAIDAYHQAQQDRLDDDLQNGEWGFDPYQFSHGEWEY